MIAPWAIVAAFVLCTPGVPAAEPPAPLVPIARASGTPASPAVQQHLAELLRRETLDGLRGEYVDEDGWGQTRQATVGYKVKGKGLNLKLEKQKKEVRHGLWKKYRVDLVDPQQHLQVQMPRLQTDRDGQLSGQLVLTARVRGEGQVERWRQGVKLLNFKVEANSTIEVRLDWQIGMRLEPAGWLRDVVVEPRVTAVGLKLADFELERLSKIDGWAAHELGDTLKGTIERELKRREPKMAIKINAAIDKRKDRLRFSPGLALSGQFEKLGSLFAGGATLPAAKK